MSLHESTHTRTRALFYIFRMRLLYINSPETSRSYMALAPLDSFVFLGKLFVIFSCSRFCAQIFPSPLRCLASFFLPPYYSSCLSRSQIPLADLIFSRYRARESFLVHLYFTSFSYFLFLNRVLVFSDQFAKAWKGRFKSVSRL